MLEKLGIDITYLALIISIMVVIFNVVFYVIRRKDQKDYENRARIGLMRSYIENEISTLNNKLTFSEADWKSINHLLISSQNKNSIDSDINNKYKIKSFIANQGINEEDIRVDKNLVFLLTPFNKSNEKEYDTVKDVCEGLEMRCIRGDENYIDGEIFKNILKNILKARIIIANIDGRNPNVFYELGIAHTLNKPTIIISKSIDKVPFDIKSKSIIIHSNREMLEEKLRKRLIDVIKN